MPSQPSKSIRWLLLGWLTTGAAQATVYPLPPPGTDVIGQVKVMYATKDDTLVDIARRFGLGYDEIVHANPGVDRWAPGEGTPIVLPTRYILPDTPREGIILNIAEMRLYYYPKANSGEERTVITYPVSIGRMDWKTPMGLTKVVAKDIDPPWRPPATIKAEHAAEGDILPDVVPGGPDNPLGRYAMRLGVPGYLIHGTNKPYGIGMRVTHGCVRMYPEDIERLFGMVPVGTPVRLVDQPVKVGRLNGQLMVESHAPLEEDNLPIKLTLEQAHQAVIAKTGPDMVGVDQATLELAVEQFSGIPVPISAPVSYPVAQPTEPAPAKSAPEAPVANRTPTPYPPATAYNPSPGPVYRPAPPGAATSLSNPTADYRYPYAYSPDTPPVTRPAPVYPAPYPYSTPPAARPSARDEIREPPTLPPPNRL
ncbi:MAG: L,D-transpeptidase family protein [Candidatus Contendobacter sp.]|nr:L,D-transpeptidase family protein [Candidatus Contendobacter sp.]